LDAGELFVACGEQTWLRVETLQLEGKKRIPAKEFANGARLASGESFAQHVANV
jgi:methionyl-tRNA formyltransferase